MGKLKSVGLARTDAEARVFARRLTNDGIKVWVGPPMREKRKGRKFRGIFAMR